VLTFHITLPALPNRRSSAFHLNAPTQSQIKQPTITN
jgi:hypothetical protein